MLGRIGVAVGMLAFSWAALAAPSTPAVPVATAAQAALESAANPLGPGVAAIILQGDTMLFRGAVGRANIELGVPLYAEQTFRIASITKMFTAATVIKLAELGKLSLDDRLSTYVADVPNGGNITLRQLLNHTAGISDKTPNPQPGFMKRDVDTATLVDEIRKRPPAFAPGTQWAYSNGGYILLGAVIEKVTGERWYVAMTKLLLEPAQLRQIRYGDNAAVIPGRVAGYSTDDATHQIKNASFISMSIPAAAGGLVATADDLVRWMHALARGQIVSAKGFQQMITPVPAMPGVSPAHQYGMGMYLWHVRGSEMIGHTGQIDGFASALVYLPKQDVIVAVLANDDGFDARTMSRRLAAIALGQPYATPVPAPLADEFLQALQGSYRIDGTTVQTLTVKDHQLFAQRSGHHAVPLQFTADGRLVFVPDELSYFVPVRDASGKVTRLDYFEGGDAPALPLPRVSETGH
ncbi:serine hydrolase domain-containing protein [Dyella kyungheensis]|uniref:Beta-lactamase family protein n=1 Tax=Dyella kyungheensis TaxID=1242174 RepID=A0ABS2JQ08_9GAMM|nr:serine hydrolase domain-containing protein [Dyella kyungheensis]MBM7120890.1 beta-lactamase family protein [Dyella kyungheensis]